jgi:hypothetical protein
MTDLRENLGWVIGSIVAAIAAFLGWFYESGLFNTILGIIIGAGIAFFVQTRTQKRVWKREYSIKIAETVYGSLYREVKSVVSSLEKKEPVHISFEQWGQFQQDHRYFMVDEEFRENLDEFFKSVREYSLAVHEFRNEHLPKIMDEEGKRIFKTTIEGVRIHADIKIREKRGIVSLRYDIADSLISRINPNDAVMKAHPDAEVLEFAVAFGNVPASSTDVGKFGEFLEACFKRMDADRNYQSLIQETNRLLEEAKSIKKKLAKRIEEPWRI